MEQNSDNSNKSLSIRISTDGLSFCVYAPAEPEPYTFSRYAVRPIVSMAANVKEALLHEPLLQADYRRVNVLITTPQFTTLPAVDFDRERVGDVYRLMFPDHERGHVTYNVLRRSGIAIIFALDESVYQLLHDDYPQARFYASAATLIEHFSERSLIGEHRQAYVYLHDAEMTVYFFDRGRMIFVNTYKVRGVNDCQYFLLSVWKTLGFDQLDDTLSVIDDDTPMSRQVADKLRYFIRSVTLLDRTEDFIHTVTSGRHTLPYDLQTLLVCGF